MHTYMYMCHVQEPHKYIDTHKHLDTDMPKTPDTYAYKTTDECRIPAKYTYTNIHT